MTNDERQSGRTTRQIKTAIEAGAKLYVIAYEREKHYVTQLAKVHSEWKQVRLGQLDDLRIAAVGELLNDKLRGVTYTKVVIDHHAYDHPQIGELLDLIKHNSKEVLLL